MLSGVEGLSSPTTLDEPAHRADRLTDFEVDDGGFTAINAGECCRAYGIIPWAGMPMDCRAALPYPVTGTTASSSPRWGPVPCVSRDHQGVLISPAFAIPQCGTRSSADFVCAECAASSTAIWRRFPPSTWTTQGERRRLDINRAAALPQTDHRWRCAALDLNPFVGREIGLQFTFDTETVLRSGRLVHRRRACDAAAKRQLLRSRPEGHENR